MLLKIGMTCPKCKSPIAWGIKSGVIGIDFTPKKLIVYGLCMKCNTYSKFPAIEFTDEDLKRINFDFKEFKP